MFLDLKIKGGTIVDGSGNAGYTGDIGVKDGRIVEIGRVNAAAAREIDADGALVTPGFIDMHTHYDAQVMWDQDFIMSARHGVTTAVMGNCGVGVAPCKPESRSGIISLLSGVEDIPVPALEAAMNWDWQTFPEYLAVIDSRPRTIDIGAYVAHAPVRDFVMGARGHDRTPATPEDCARMAGVVREALEAGAMGFSTDRIFEHRMANGAHVPDYDASAEELLAIADAVRAVPGRTIQFASDFHQFRGRETMWQDVELLEAIARRGQCPVSMQLLEWPNLGENGWREIRDRLEGFNAAGNRIRFEVPIRAIGLMLGLGLSLHPFLMHPSYAELRDLPLAERATRMRNPDMRARMLAETATGKSGNDTLDEMIAAMAVLGDRIYRSTPSRAFEPTREDSIAAVAEVRGQTVMEAYYDILSAGDGSTTIYWPLRNFEQGNLDVVREMLMDGSALMSFGDAGAHASMICDSAYTTFALSYWARDRELGERIPIERLVHLMSGAQASHFGMQDRGQLKLGLRADINVIDPATVRLEAMSTANDLPGGCQRMLQFAKGYRTTLVAGTAIVVDDQLTGERPGRLMRAGMRA